MDFYCLQIAGNILTGNAISGGAGSIGIDLATGKYMRVCMYTLMSWFILVDNSDQR